MKNDTKSEYLIEQFTLKEESYGDLAELISSAFINDGAAQENGASIIFTENTFRMMFGAPTADKNLFVKATYLPTNKIVGFLGAIPRDLKILDKVHKFVIPSWLCVHTEHQRNGLATALGEKIYEICINAGYEGGFSLFEPDQYGKDISQIVSKTKGFPIKRVTSTDRFVVRVFDANKIAKVIKIKWYEKLVFKLLQGVAVPKTNYVRWFQKKDTDVLFNLLMEHVNRNQLSIVPKKEDFSWVLEQPGVICVVYTNQNDVPKGFMLAWEFNLAGFGKSFPCGWLDMVHIHKLKSNEAKDLANFLSISAKKKNWIAIQTPFIPYFNPKPLKNAKFIFFPQSLSLDMMLAKEIDLPENVDSFYFDWR